MLYNILKVTAFLLAKLLFRLSVSGSNNIPKKGGFILASNHISYLDPVILGCACPRKLNFMAKYDLFSAPVFAALISRLGAFAVKRNTADISALREALNRVKSGNGLVIFPEGSRVNANMNLKPQPGIGFLASKTNVPVIPAFISGTDKALPKGSKMIKTEKIFIRFGKQISVERRVPYQQTADLIMNNIRRLYNIAG